MPIEGQIALVTAGAKRIGQALVESLAHRKCRVAVHHLSSRSEAEKLIEELQSKGVESLAVSADLSVRKEVERMVTTVEERLGPIDILINNASIFEKTPWFEISESDWDRHLNINLKGPFLCAWTVSRGMVERKCGNIINLIDWTAERPHPDYIPYAVSKAGLAAMTKGLARALAPHVRVNAIALGAILFPEGTPETEKEKILQQVPLARTGSVNDIAQTVQYLLEGTDYTTGATINVDGGRGVV